MTTHRDAQTKRLKHPPFGVSVCYLFYINFINKQALFLYLKINFPFLYRFLIAFIGLFLSN